MSGLVFNSRQWFTATNEYTFDSTAVAEYTIFTVTGDVLVTVFGICQTALTGSGSVSVGRGASAGAVDDLIGAIAATNIAAGEMMWFNAGANPDDTPTSPFSPASATSWGYGVHSSGDNIIIDVSSDTIDSGVINYYCIWRPLSSGASVVTA